MSSLMQALNRLWNRPQEGETDVGTETPISAEETAEPAPFRYSEEFISAIADYYRGDPSLRSEEVMIEVYRKREWQHGLFAACKPYMEFKTPRCSEGPIGRRFLEVGCGTGYTSVAAHELGMRPEATDFVERAREMAAWRFREHGIDIPVFHSDIRHLVPPERLERYGFVFCQQVLEHLSRRDQFLALKHLFQMVEPSGFLFIDTENSLCPFDRHDTHLPLLRLLSQPHAIALAQKLGVAINFAEPSSGGSQVALHDYMTYDELVGAAKVMGFEVVNPFMPYGDARQHLHVLTGSNWLYDNIGKYFEVEKFLPIAVLLQRRS